MSVSLGAFLAGLVVSESRHSAHALGEVLPLQILFSATFFLSVGTLLDVRFLIEEPLLVLAAGALVLIVKSVTTFGAALATGVGAATAASTALLLAQVGEFAFALERLGRDAGLTPAGLGEEGSQSFIAATVLLLVATPGLASAGRAIGARLTRREQAQVPVVAADPHAPAGGDVLISGSGASARHLAIELTARGVDVTVVTLSPDGAAEAKELGLRVVRGDSTRSSVLLTAGADAARLVVLGDDDPEQAARIAGVVSTLAAQPPVVVLADDDSAIAELHAAGARSVVLAERAAHARLTDAVVARLQPREPAQRTVVDTASVVQFQASEATACVHAPVSRPVVPWTPGCTECLREGTEWVHLRLRTSCGHVGCCDGSPGRHATGHYEQSDHPVMCSAEPGDTWGWYYLDQATPSGRSRAGSPLTHERRGFGTQVGRRLQDCT